MNKQERKLKALTKQKRRISIFSANGFKKLGINWIHKLRSMSTVCSCAMCSPSKEIPKGEVKKKQKLMKYELDHYLTAYDGVDFPNSEINENISQKKKLWFICAHKNGEDIIYDFDENVKMISQGGIYTSKATGVQTIEELYERNKILDNCSSCGQSFKTTWNEPTRSEMIKKHICFSCNFWLFQLNRKGAIIINGHKYQDGGKIDKSTTGGFVGYGGRDFKIEFNTGKIIETNNLWSQGQLPDRFKEKFPDNAKFL